VIKLKIKKARREFNINPDLLLITGDGWSAIEDIKGFNEYELDYDIMAIGRSINLHNGHPVDHWANVDADCSVNWAENLPKVARDGNMPIRHTLGDCRGFDVDWDIDGEIPWDISEIMWHGSTALFAVLAAFTMGYQKLVLAGVPLDSKGHWYWDENTQPQYPDPPWSYQTYQAWFEFAETPEAKQVRSMSGYTRTLLGEPTQKWLSRA